MARPTADRPRQPAGALRWAEHHRPELALALAGDLWFFWGGRLVVQVNFVVEPSPRDTCVRRLRLSRELVQIRATELAPAVFYLVDHPNQPLQQWDLQAEVPRVGHDRLKMRIHL